MKFLVHGEGSTGVFHLCRLLFLQNDQSSQSSAITGVGSSSVYCWFELEETTKIKWAQLSKFICFSRLFIWKAAGLWFWYTFRQLRDIMNSACLSLSSPSPCCWWSFSIINLHPVSSSCQYYFSGAAPFISPSHSLCGPLPLSPCLSFLSALLDPGSILGLVQMSGGGFFQQSLCDCL